MFKARSEEGAGAGAGRAASVDSGAADADADPGAGALGEPVRAGLLGLDSGFLARSGVCVRRTLELAGMVAGFVDPG